MAQLSVRSGSHSDAKDLVIAAARSVSIRGDIESNVSEHLKFIRAAASVGAKLVVFPELSLTGYELDLAATLQLEPYDARIEPLRLAASLHDMHLLVGAPWASGSSQPFLGAFLISPTRTGCYAKIHVHEIEAPYFASGNESCIAMIERTPMALAICADTSHPAHAADAAARGAELYLASVMKSRSEYPAHAARLRQYAVQHDMTVLTANYAGSTGGEPSAGKSAIWDSRGKPVARADGNDRSIVVARRSAGGWHGQVVDVQA